MHDEILERFRACFQSFETGDVDPAALAQVYAPGVLFEDPFRRIEGRDALGNYLQKLYANVEYCRFDFMRHWQDRDSAVLAWNMSLRHPRLNRGREFRVDGASELHFRDKISHHRDYFDSNALLFEQLPVLGSFMKFLKRRAG